MGEDVKYLKVKDNVDLDELLKFGFKKVDYSEGEIETIVIGIIHRTGSDNFGQIMKQAKAEIGNSADGKLISEVIREVLSK